MGKQVAVELAQAAAEIRVVGRLHFLQHEGMAADGALAEDDEAARENVRTFDRDRYRYALIDAREIVRAAEHDAFAALYVHGIVGHPPRQLGTVILEYRRRYRWPFAARDRGCRDRQAGVDDVGESGHPRQRLTHTLEFTDREIELATQARVDAGGVTAPASPVQLPVANSRAG